MKTRDTNEYTNRRFIYANQRIDKNSLNLIK